LGRGVLSWRVLALSVQVTSAPPQHRAYRLPLQAVLVGTSLRGGWSTRLGPSRPQGSRTVCFGSGGLPVQSPCEVTALQKPPGVGRLVHVCRFGGVSSRPFDRTETASARRRQLPTSALRGTGHLHPFFVHVVHSQPVVHHFRRGPDRGGGAGGVGRLFEYAPPKSPHRPPHRALHAFPPKLLFATQ